MKEQLDKVLTSNQTINRSQFECAERVFDDLLHAAEATQQLGNLLVDYHGNDWPEQNICWLVHALGRHTQILRNQAAKELEPIFKAYGAEPIGY